MNFEHYYYLLINLAAISIPFIAGFDRRLKFYRLWKYLIPAMLITMLVFIPWDIIKTAKGVWGFNPDYLTGIYIFNLPLEELLFFIAIPYACMFTYYAMGYVISYGKFTNSAKAVTVTLIIGLLALAIKNVSLTYTFVTFSTTAIFLALHLLYARQDYMGRFYITFLVILFPFFLVNGALTGMFTPEPVVWYDDTKNLGLRIGTIPIEDSVYALLLLLMNTTIYEALKTRSVVGKTIMEGKKNTNLEGKEKTTLEGF